jgi:hypothetical protein
MPDLLSSWLGSTLLSDTEYGGFLVMTGPHEQHTGIVTACEPPHYFQASVDDPPHSATTVLLDVVPARRGAHLILTHGGIHHSRLRHFDNLWRTALEQLDREVRGGSGSGIRPATQ